MPYYLLNVKLFTDKLLSSRRKFYIFIYERHIKPLMEGASL